MKQRFPRTAFFKCHTCQKKKLHNFRVISPAFLQTCRWAVFFEVPCVHCKWGHRAKLIQQPRLFFCKSKLIDNLRFWQIHCRQRVHNFLTDFHPEPSFKIRCSSSLIWRQLWKITSVFQKIDDRYVCLHCFHRWWVRYSNHWTAYTYVHHTSSEISIVARKTNYLQKWCFCAMWTVENRLSQFTDLYFTTAVWQYQRFHRQRSCKRETV